MKKLLIAALATTAFAATPAFAQTAQGEIAISANVAKACGVGNHLSGAAADPAWDQADITVAVADGRIPAQTFNNRSFGNVWCNGSANVSLEVGALMSTNSTTDTGSFTNRYDLVVNTDAAVYVGRPAGTTMTTVSDTDGVVTLTGSTGGAFETGLRGYSGANSIQVIADPSNRRAVAGDYHGYVRFTATAI
jgi:hypothetical protein